MKSKPSPPRRANLLLVISFCLLLAVSYLFISQPAYDSSVLQNTPRIQYFDAEDSYILQKADGTYWLYIVAGGKPERYSYNRQRLLPAH